MALGRARSRGCDVLPYLPILKSCEAVANDPIVDESRAARQGGLQQAKVMQKRRRQAGFET